MTSEELKEVIDETITNKTTPGSILPTNVGGRLKDVVDYVCVGYQQTEISDAQFLNSFSVPIVVIDAPGEGKARFPIHVFVKRHNGTPYTVSGVAIVNYLGAAAVSLNNGLFTNSSGVQAVLATTSQLNTASSDGDLAYDDQAFYLKALPSNPTGGTGGLTIYITYNEVTL